MNYNQPETDNIDTQYCKKCWKKYRDEKTLKKSFEIEIDFVTEFSTDGNYLEANKIKINIIDSKNF